MKIDEINREEPTDEVDGRAHEYRFSRIIEIQREITREREKRAVLCGKYHRCVRIIGAIDDVLPVAASGLTMAGVGVLATILAVPIATAVVGAAAGGGVFCLIGGQVKKKLALKLEKHEKIKTLAEAKLNSISDYVSKALEDDYISEQEFSLVLSELEKFNNMKEEVRSKTKDSIDDETKKSFIARKREEMIASFQNVKRKT